MPSFPTSEGRRSKRVMLKRRASLVVNLDRDEKRLPCLVLDSSKEGYRLRGSFHLRPGQFVEIVFDPEPFRSVRCRVSGWAKLTQSRREKSAWRFAR
jgi:hypothetical protein